MTTYKTCQSCGMPLKNDKNRESEKYCSHCYQNGEFTSPNISLEEMKELVLNKMVEMKMLKILGKAFVKKLDKLERWNNK